MTIDDLTAERIGLGWLRAAVAPAGPLGRRAEDEAVPFGPGDDAAARAAISAIVETAAAWSAGETARLRGVLAALPDPEALVGRARLGETLDDLDLHRIAGFCAGVAALAPACTFPGLEPLAAALAPGRRGDGFYLDASFAPPLAAARARFTQTETAADAARGALAERLRAAWGIELAGEEVVALDGRDAAPVDGLRLVRRAPGYRVYAVELDVPGRAAAAAALAAAEDEARAALTAAVAGAAAAILAAARETGAFDRFVARVAFAQRWGGCVPSLAPAFACDDAVFVPLAAALADAGLAYVPLSFAIDGAAVLTGPNMGGKSAALATAGFVCACAALGVPPPARAATLPLLGTIAWVGDAGAGERGPLLSSFGAEVLRARDALAGAAPATLVLVDEFARTTAPREARALLVALLLALRARGALVLAATHLDGVAAAAGATALRVAGLRGTLPAATGDPRAALAALAAAIDRRIIPDDGPPPAAEALAVAQALGLDPAVVADARARLGR